MSSGASTRMRAPTGESGAADHNPCGSSQSAIASPNATGSIEVGGAASSERAWNTMRRAASHDSDAGAPEGGCSDRFGRSVDADAAASNATEAAGEAEETPRADTVSCGARVTIHNTGMATASTTATSALRTKRSVPDAPRWLTKPSICGEKFAFPTRLRRAHPRSRRRELPCSLTQPRRPHRAPGGELAASPAPAPRAAARALCSHRAARRASRASPPLRRSIAHAR